jgi:kumamolisin
MSPVTPTPRPLWAALIARMAQQLGSPLGLVQPKLYGVKSGFNDITEGNNGAFAAATGWDACTGLGSPDGSALLRALTKTS